MTVPQERPDKNVWATKTACSTDILVCADRTLPTSGWPTDPSASTRLIRMTVPQERPDKNVWATKTACSTDILVCADRRYQRAAGPIDLRRLRASQDDSSGSQWGGGAPPPRCWRIES